MPVPGQACVPGSSVPCPFRVERARSGRAAELEGSRHASSSRYALFLKTTTRLSDIELSDWQGTPVRLGSLWADQPIVLVFIRHFG